jgi:hypothetical protein
MAKKCPTCDSPDPARHPAVQFEGEVSICPNLFHSPGSTAEPQDVVLKLTLTDTASRRSPERLRAIVDSELLRSVNLLDVVIDVQIAP